jgi:hypothetical protein
MVARERVMEARQAGVTELIEGVNVPPIYLWGDVVLDSARDLARFAAGALVDVENKTLLHDQAFSISTRLS